MSAMPVCLVVAIGVGATMTTFLGRAVVEQNRVLQQAAKERVLWRSVGEIELAKNVILNSNYTDGVNDEIQAALASDPPLIAGTPVAIEPAGPSRWYRLSSTNDFGGMVGAANCLIRDGLSYTAYNYYVEGQDLGVSGKPKGRIFTNRTLELYFAGGVYDGYVEAGEGFAYKNGADAENTIFLRGADPAAPAKSLLSAIDFGAFAASADWSAPEGLIAEVAFKKTSVAIKLFEPDSTTLVPVEKTRQVQVGTTVETVTKPLYEYVWQWVDTKKSRKVWVENTGAGAGGGTDVGGGSTGYWKTEYYWELVWTKVKVQIGTYETTETVPVYATETYTDWVSQAVAGALVTTVTRGTSGVLWFPGQIRAIAGDVSGKVTLVTGSSARITGNLRYVDGNGDCAYLNGTNPTAGEYAPNPLFDRNHALGIIALGDINYARTVPTNLEINANLISATGTVAMEGIVLAADGTPSRSGSAAVKNSLRRFGSIMCLQRPVATLLSNTGTVSHGFKAGSSVYDAGALNDPPPGFPNEETLAFLETVRVNADGFVDPGPPAAVSGVSPLTGMRSFDEVRDWTVQRPYDWGINDRKVRTLDETRTPPPPSLIDQLKRLLGGGGKTAPQGGQSILGNQQ